MNYVPLALSIHRYLSAVFLALLIVSISAFAEHEQTELWEEACAMPPLPLQPRVENRSFPSVFSAWGGNTWSSVLNQPHLPVRKQMAQHDLWFGTLVFEQEFVHTGDAWIVRHDERRWREHPAAIRDAYLAENPNMIFLAGINMREIDRGTFPADSPHWLRNEEGERIHAWNGSMFLDFTKPVVQQMIIQKAVAVSKCGLYDGIFLDWWSEDSVILADDEVGWIDGYVGLEAEQRARDVIIQGIRNNVRENFLIMVNTIRKIPRTSPYINGAFMETGMPVYHYNVGGDEKVESGLAEIEDTLSWAEENLKSPQINGLEGFGFDDEPPDSPTNLRWMRVFTTLSLTFSDGYALFNNGKGHHHFWYDFWDADLGKPVSPKAQLYQDIDGLYIREFTNGWAVYNHSGAPQVITLPEEVQGAASGLAGMEHALPNLDGEMYLKPTQPINFPHIDTSDIYMADPIHAIPDAVFILDASHNLGSITRWINHGTAGGTLLAWDGLPILEEGEITIPSIGFRDYRQYYTASASRDAFGGPISEHLELHLGDWTLEFLCKRNGNAFAMEHQFAGFQNSPREGLQGIRLRLSDERQELEMSIHADGFKQPERALNIFLGKKRVDMGDYCFPKR